MKLDIKNGEIRQLIIGDAVLPLKKRIKLNEAEKLQEIADFLEEHIDFTSISTEREVEKNKEEGFEWTKDELISFLDQIDSERQKIFLKSLAKHPDRLTWDHLKKLMDNEGEKILPFSMAGILSCLSRRAKHFGRKESFWESNWDYKTDERYYILKDSYKKIFSEYFG